MGMIKHDDGWRIPEALWAQMEVLLPPRKAHPLGCHRPRVSDRAAMNAILFVLRTGAQWAALNATGICGCFCEHPVLTSPRQPTVRCRTDSILHFSYTLHSVLAAL